MLLSLITFTVSLFVLIVFFSIKRFEHASGRIIIPQEAFTKSDRLFHCFLINIKKFFRACLRFFAHLGFVLGKIVRRVRLAIAKQIFALANLVRGKSKDDTSSTELLDDN